MKRTLLLLFLLIALDSLSQTKLTIEGVITDSETQFPIADAQVTILGTPYSALSNTEGKYKLICLQQLDTFTLVISKSNYSSQIRSGQKGIEINETRSDRINFELKFESYLLPEVSINTDPDTVWGDKFLNVADFAFKGDQMLLLTYEKEERWKRLEDAKTTLYNGCRIILLNHQQKEIARLAVYDKALEFYTDYLQEIFLMCKEHTYHISIEDDSIVLTPVDRKEFDNAIKPVIDTLGNYTCFSNFDHDYPAFDYMLYNKIDSSYFSFRAMLDEQQMEMFRSEYKYLGPKEKLEAFRFELNTGIDKEIVAAYMTGYQNSIYYEPVNAPLLVCNETLLIFDHHHDKLIRYNWNGDALDSTLISYHKTRKPLKWSEKVMKDNKTDQVFTCYMHNSKCLIKKINPVSGQAKHCAELTYPFVDKIRISGNFAYYIYRPFESSQNRFLYREPLCEED